ncbi:MAG: TetR/AcrR family transcriptional regulator [Desulfohalobiaceae bacterium]|nr:TetR/AcrR family transcriptional regulator [Desulfohalobiaceae bacterium]
MSKKSTFLQLKENERAYRRDIILSAAFHLFGQYSFHDVGMRDVAEEAGISPASIYRYFSSRDDILVEILSQEISNGREKQWRRVESGDTTLEEIAAGIVDFFWERESTLQIVGHFLWNYDVDEEAKQKFRGLQKSYLDEFDRVLLGMGCEVKNVRLLSKSFFASLFGIIASYRNYPQGADTENAYNNLHLLAQATAGIFKNGMQHVDLEAIHGVGASPHAPGHE